MNNELVIQRLEEIEDRLNSSSPGPWRRTSGFDPSIYDKAGWCVINQVCSGVNDEDDSGDRNANLLVHIPEDLRFLLSYIREQKKEG